MGQRSEKNLLTTVEAILAHEIEEKQKAGESFDDLSAISERLRLAKLEYPDPDNKASLAARAGLAVGICASALLLSGSASPGDTIPVAPTVQMHGGAPANRF